MRIRLFFVASVIGFFMGGCDRKQPPAQSPSAPAPAQSTGTTTDGTTTSDEKSTTADFLAFAEKFSNRVVEGYASDRVTIESTDIERTQSAIQPWRGKIVARVAASDTAKGVDWRLTYRFERRDGKWFPVTTDVEAVRDDLGHSKTLLGTMRQTSQRMAEAFTIMVYKD